MAVIYTIGHSTKPFADLLAKLREHRIQVLVDVRTTPRSRFNPQYNEKRLKEALEREGIEYRWKGSNLGGRGVNVDYEETLDELAQEATEGKQLCLMCSEGDFHKCHRHTMLEPSLLARGIAVEHMLYTTNAA